MPDPRRHTKRQRAMLSTAHALADSAIRGDSDAAASGWPSLGRGHSGAVRPRRAESSTRMTTAGAAQERVAA
jgi:hypothetical protein